MRQRARRRNSRSATIGRAAMFVIAALALLLLAGVYFALRPGAGGAKSTPPRATAEGNASTAGSTLQRVDDSAPAAPASPAPPPAPEEAPRSALATPAAERTPDAHAGVVIVTAPDGRDLSHEHGELVISASGGAAHPERSVHFRDGRFALDGLPAGRLRIARATGTLEGASRPIRLDHEELELRPGEPLVVRGRYLRDSTLLVVDARTGRALDHVGVLPKLAEHAGPEQRHPGPHFRASFAIHGATSPVRLPSARGVRSYWVTARGHAWSFVQVDHESGGEREVRLDPAGRLEVQVRGADPTVLVQIRVRQRAAGDSGGIATACALNEGGWQGFDGLAEGSYDVSAEVGRTDGPPIVLGSARAQVRGGETTTAVVELAGDSVAVPVAVRGQLVLPTEHRALEVALRIRPADGIVFRSGDEKYIARNAMGGGPASELLAWTADRLTPGRYLFLVEPVQHYLLVDVPRAPVENLRIALPPLHSVAVHVVDARTHGSIDGALVRWTREPPDGAGAPEWTSALAAPGGVLDVVLPLGPFSVSASSPAYSEASANGRVGAGETTITIELEPRIQRGVVLVHGDVVIPWSQESSCGVRGVGAAEARACRPTDDGEMHAYFAEPGLYELSVEPPTGFRRPEPVVVSIDAGEHAPVVVQLSR